jgi:hypothetical protein
MPSLPRLKSPPVTLPHLMAACRRWGAHWYDPASPEYHGQPFKTTLIYGFYDGHINFIEPMVAKSFLDSKLSFTGDFARPAQYLIDGYYPSRYSVSYDATKKEYDISLSLMVHF